MPREDIEFSADNVTLRGWFYPAEGADSKGPLVVMVHGLSAVKEMYLDDYAESFSQARLFRGHFRLLRSSRATPI